MACVYNLSTVEEGTGGSLRLTNGSCQLNYEPQVPVREAISKDNVGIDRGATSKIDFCLGRVSMAAIEHHAPKQAEEERVCFSL